MHEEWVHTYTMHTSTGNVCHCWWLAFKNLEVGFAERQDGTYVTDKSILCYYCTSVQVVRRDNKMYVHVKIFSKQTRSALQTDPSI